MSDEYIEPITPEVLDDPPDNSTKYLIITLVALVVLCFCLCCCIFVFLPALFGPTVGDVFSDVIDEMMLTPIP